MQPQALNIELTFALEVDENRNPGDLLLAFGELGKDNEAPEPGSPSHTLQLKRERVEIVVCNRSTPHDSHGTKPLEDHDGK